jgi:hypothetical protein
MNARASQWLAVLWIAVNLYVWGLLSAPPPFSFFPPLQRVLEQHRTILLRGFSRPYVWSKEGE